MGSAAHPGQLHSQVRTRPPTGKRWLRRGRLLPRSRPTAACLCTPRACCRIARQQGAPTSFERACRPLFGDTLFAPFDAGTAKFGRAGARWCTAVALSAALQSLQRRVRASICLLIVSQRDHRVLPDCVPSDCVLPVRTPCLPVRTRCAYASPYMLDTAPNRASSMPFCRLRSFLCYRCVLVACRSVARTQSCKK